MTISITQRHTPADSNNEHTSGRRIDAQQQFIAFRITETGNTDPTGKFTLTHVPIGSLTRQFDRLSNIEKEPDLVILTAADVPLYSHEFDQNDKTLKLYTDVDRTIPAANLTGVKISYWYYAPIEGILNDNGTFTPKVSPLIPYPFLVQIEAGDANIGEVSVEGFGGIVEGLEEISEPLRSLENNVDTIMRGDTPIATQVTAPVETVLVKGITTHEGDPGLFIDETKNFEAETLVGKTAKLSINNTEYYRTIIDNSGSGIIVTPIQTATSANVILTGTATPPNGTLRVQYNIPGIEGNEATVYLVENTTSIPGQPMLGMLVDNKHLIITSATMEVEPGDSLGFTATDVANYINNDPDGLGLDNFIAIVEEAGQLDATTEPAPFTGGQDAVVIPKDTPYEIVDYGVSSGGFGSTGLLEDKIDSVINGSASVATRLFEQTSDVFTILNLADTNGYSEELDVSKYGMIRVHISKNDYYNGVLTFQGSIADNAWRTIPVKNVNTGMLVEDITNDSSIQYFSEDYFVDTRGLNKIRVKVGYRTAGYVHVVGCGELWPETQYVYIANAGNTVVEQRTQVDADNNNVVTFTENITAIEIYHAETEWQHFVVNGIALKIPAGGYRTSIAGTPGKTVTIPANIDCIVRRLI